VSVVDSPLRHCLAATYKSAQGHATASVVVVVLVVVGPVVVVGTPSLNAGTHSSATDFATSTAGPKLVLFTDTVVAANLAPFGGFAW